MVSAIGSLWEIAGLTLGLLSISKTDLEVSTLSLGRAYVLGCLSSIEALKIPVLSSTSLLDGSIQTS